MWLLGKQYDAFWLVNLLLIFTAGKFSFSSFATTTHKFLRKSRVLLGSLHFRRILRFTRLTTDCMRSIFFYVFIVEKQKYEEFC